MKCQKFKVVTAIIITIVICQVCIISLFEHREPNYRNGKEIEFLNDNQLQNNWNELKKWLESKGTSTKEENDALCYFYTYKKMQELEQGKDEQ